jgi:hypothetical protein
MAQVSPTGAWRQSDLTWKKPPAELELKERYAESAIVYFSPAIIYGLGGLPISGICLALGFAVPLVPTPNVRDVLYSAVASEGHGKREVPRSGCDECVSPTPIITI